MEHEHETPKDRSEHKPVDPGRSAAREQREPGKRYTPKRSEPDSSPDRKPPRRD
jgi:hypothetical protein